MHGRVGAGVVWSWVGTLASPIAGHLLNLRLLVEPFQIMKNRAWQTLRFAMLYFILNTTVRGTSPGSNHQFDYL